MLSAVVRGLVYDESVDCKISLRKGDLRLIKNNLLALVLYFVISLVTDLLAGYSSEALGNHMTAWELLFSIPILVATLAMFVLTGRYALATQRSSLLNFVSVLLICVLGLLCAPSIASFKPHSVGDLSAPSFYFLYVVPVAFTVQPFVSTFDPLEVGRGLPSILFAILYSALPTVLMWVGLQWQFRHRQSR